MTQDEIIEMARQAGCFEKHQVFYFTQQDLETFAKLVAEKEREWLLGYIQEHQPSCEQMSNAIRARVQV
jgi:hypothetical protein